MGDFGISRWMKNVIEDDVPVEHGSISWNPLTFYHCAGQMLSLVHDRTVKIPEEENNEDFGVLVNHDQNPEHPKSR